VPTETIQTTDPAHDIARAEARLPWLMGAIAFVATLGVVVTGHVRAGGGLAFGAALAILNYRWLHQATSNLFAAGQTRVPKMVVAKFALRYPLAFASLFLFYKTEWLPFTAILAGLFVPVGGILIEAMLQLREGLRIVGPGLGPATGRPEGRPYK
jgi:hypothetical protein